jgi:hypothetical protein
MNHVDQVRAQWAERRAAEADVQRRALVDGVARTRMLYGTVPATRALEPLLVDGASWDIVARGAAAVARAASTVVDAVIEREDLRRRLDLTDVEAAFVAAEPRPRSRASIQRLDAFVSTSDAGESAVKFLEINPSPGGVYDTSAMASILRPLLQGVEGARVLWPDPLPRFVAAFRARARKDAPVAGVVVGDGPPQEGNDVEIDNIVGHLVGQGFRPVMAHVSAFTFEGGVARLDGVAVDLVHHELPELHAQRASHPLWRAVDAGAVREFYPSTHALVAGNKAIFALLCDDEIMGSLVDAATLRLLREHVPWTAVLKDQAAMVGGAKVSLLEYVRAHRAELVLKPARGFGGHGVVLGWDVNDARWDAAISAALTTSTVVQRRASAGTAPIPIVEGDLASGRIQTRVMNVDLSPYVWDESEVEGAMVRATTSSGLMNMAAGQASELALAVVREQAAVSGSAARATPL